MLSFSSFHLFPFPFPPPSHWGLSSETATSPSSCSTHRGQNLTHHFHLYLLCQKGLRWPTARPAATTSTLPPLSHTTASSAIQSTHFREHRWMDLECPGMLCRSAFFFFWLCMSACPIICKLKRREKRNNPHHHNANITPITIILKSMPDSFNIWITYEFFSIVLALAPGMLNTVCEKL